MTGTKNTKTAASPSKAAEVTATGSGNDDALTQARPAVSPKSKSRKMKNITTALRTISHRVKHTFSPSTSSFAQRARLDSIFGLSNSRSSNATTATETAANEKITQSAKEPFAVAFGNALKEGTLDADKLADLKYELFQILNDTIIGAAEIPDDNTLDSESFAPGGSTTRTTRRLSDASSLTPKTEIIERRIKKDPMLFVGIAIKADNPVSVPPAGTSPASREILQLCHGDLHHKTSTEVERDLNYPEFDVGSDIRLYRNSERALPCYLTNAAKDKPEPYLECPSRSSALGSMVRYVVDIGSNRVYLSGVSTTGDKQEPDTQGNDAENVIGKGAEDPYAAYGPFVELTGEWDTTGMLVEAKKLWAQSFAQDKGKPGHEYLSESQYGACRDQMVIQRCIDDPDWLQEVSHAPTDSQHPINQLSEQTQEFLRAAMAE